MILVQLTDLHLAPPGHALYRVVETNILAERAMRAVRDLRVRADAVVVTGDVAADGRESEYAVFAAMARRELAGTPLYVIPGNHDRRETMRAALAAFPGVAADPAFIQYTVEDLPMRLVMLDTVVPGEPHGELCARRLTWLDETLAAAPHRPTIVAMHHPPFVCGIGHMDAIILRDIPRFAAVIARHRQVRRVLCGHHHRTIFAPFEHAIASIGPSVAHQVELDLRPGADAFFFMEPPAFHIHALQPDGVLATHTAFVETYPGPYPFIPEPEYQRVAQ